MKRLLIISLCVVLLFLSCKNEENPVQTTQESISTPNTPTGPSTGYIYESLTFSISGAESSLGHDLEYQYYWGDFEYSNWSTSTSASHSWSYTGTMYVKARARCEEHTDIISEWSNTKQITISQASHTVSTPNIPSGPDSGEVDESLSFSTGGATCNQGHSVQYRFSWGDATYSDWSSSTTATHSWSGSGTKYIKAQARCSQNTTIVSDWSNTKTIEITSDIHEVPPPDQPSGTDNGITEEYYTFTTGGSSCSQGHAVQYRFSWGDEVISSWLDTSSQDYSWSNPGTYDVQAQARCAEDTTVISDWSPSLTIEIEEQIDSNIVFVANYDTPGTAHGIDKSDRYVYLAAGNGGLQIINIANPSCPYLVGQFSTDDVNSVYVESGYAYIACLFDGIKIVRVTDASNPVLISSYGTHKAYDLYKRGDYVYVADGSQGLKIIDVSDPFNPVFVSEYDTQDQAVGIRVFNYHAYIADNSSGLQIINVSDPENPAFVSSYTTDFTYTKGVTYGGAYSNTSNIYLAGWNWEGGGGLEIVNIIDPGNPRFVNSYQVDGSGTGITCSGDWAFLHKGSDGIEMIDKSNPYNLVFYAEYDTPGFLYDTYVEHSGNYLFLANGDSGLLILQFNPSN